MERAISKDRGSKGVKKRTSAGSVDGYLAGVPEKARAVLEELRATIRAAAPKADEVISYQIPTFRFHGSLVSFAAFKDHCSFFVMSPAVVEAHKDQLERYDTAAGTIQFTVDAPLPAAIVKKLVKARIKENTARTTR